MYFGRRCKESDLFRVGSEGRNAVILSEKERKFVTFGDLMSPFRRDARHAIA